MRTGHYSFHTVNWDPAPWWQIDFGQSVAISGLAIFNRERYPERADTLRVLVSQDGESWETVFDNTDLPSGERTFGGIVSGPREVLTPGLKARIVRLALAKKGPFHLDGLDILGEGEASGKEALALVLSQAEVGMTEVAAANFSRIALPLPAIIRMTKQPGVVVTSKGAAILIGGLIARSGLREARRWLAGLAKSEQDWPEAWAALIQGIIGKNLPEAKELYTRLARSAPDYAGLAKLQEKILAAEGLGSEQTIKLLIWDLDDTLWTGTLAEGDEVAINERRRDFILKANQYGLISSVCSKNERDLALARLEQFGLLDALIHPVMAFRPKGELVKNLIAALQLREQNVMFIDDNPLNLNEVKFVCPRIQVLNALDANADEVLDRLIATAKQDNGKRHREYKVLAQKLAEAEVFGGDNEEFLSQSRIKIAIVRGARNLRFASRIEELVNRSNQMNFLKTRIPEGTGTFLIGNFSEVDTYSVFVRDRYGSYGLVGFAAVEVRAKKLVHFAFSCRIMNMNVENAVLARIVARYGTQAVEVKPKTLDYLAIDDGSDPAFDADFASASSKTVPDIAVMANCQSGVIAHYMGLVDRTHAEQWPDIFTLASRGSTAAAYSKTYRHLVYGLFNEYKQDYWPDGFTAEGFRSALDCAMDAWLEDKAQVYLLVPPESSLAAVNDTAGAPCSFGDLNQIARGCASTHPNVHLIDIGAFDQEPGDISRDQRHYSRTLLRRLAERVRSLIGSDHKTGEPEQATEGISSRAEAVPVEA
jgi:FkbH-like protein